MEDQITPESVSIIEKAKISEAEGQSAFMNPEPKKAKKGPGRPKKENSEKSETKPHEPKKQTEQKGPMIETKALCYPLVKGVSVIGVSYTGDPRAALSAQEADQMAEAMGLIFDKYMPDMMQNWGAEAALVMAFGQYGLRLYAIKKLQQETQRPQPTQQKQPEFQQEIKNDLVIDPQPMTL